MQISNLFKPVSNWEYIDGGVNFMSYKSTGPGQEREGETRVKGGFGDH